MVFVASGGLSVVTLDKYRRRVQKWARSGAGPMLPVEVVLSTGSNCAARGYGGSGGRSPAQRASRIEVGRSEQQGSPR